MGRRILCEYSNQTVAKYIREQEQHDIVMDKLSVKEYRDPFEEKRITKEKKKEKKRRAEEEEILEDELNRLTENE